MIRLDDTADRYKYTAANPQTFGSKATYTKDKTFKCLYRSNTASENVRAGRDATGETGKFYYYPRYVSFAMGDRILYKGAYYDILYIPSMTAPKLIDYIDVKAQQ